MNILLTGATGFIGLALLRSLLAQGHQVTACCRDTKQLLLADDALKILTVDFANTDSVAFWLPHLQGIEAVINAVGIIAETPRQSFAQLHTAAPIALFTAAAQAGVKRILQISALGANEQASTAYQLSKKAADDALRALAVDWFVLQPSVVYGDRARSSALLHALAASPVHILPEGGKQLLQPIAIEDLVTVVVCCLKTDHTQQTLALVGAEAISYAELLQGLRRRLGKAPADCYTVSYRALFVMARFTLLLNEPILSKDNIVMLSRGNTANVLAVSQLLQRSPANIRQFFNQPATQAERWHAELYFLKPVLCWVIALVWLWSGITSLFFYPHQQSYQLLAALGITSSLVATIALYGLALLDIALGIATLCRYRVSNLLLGQMAIVLVYSVVVSIALPEFVFHPFGAVLKNLPFLMCLWIYRTLAGERS